MKQKIDVAKFVDALFAPTSRKNVRTTPSKKQSYTAVFDELLLRAIIEYEKPTKPVYGVASSGDDDSLNLLLHDPNSGRTIKASGRYEDPQSTSVPTDDGVSACSLKCDVRARDSTVPIMNRIESLDEWLGASLPDASAYVLEELERVDIGGEWLDGVIESATTARFPSHSDQVRLAKALLRWAAILRTERRPAARRVVNAAILRAGTLLDVAQLPELIPFLSPPRGVDTRLAALQAIVRVLEANSDRDVSQQLFDRIAELTGKILDADLLLPGLSAGIALEGLAALALLNGDAASSYLASARNIGFDWFSEMVLQRIKVDSMLNASQNAVATA